MRGCERAGVLLVPFPRGLLSSDFCAVFFTTRNVFYTISRAGVPADFHEFVKKIGSLRNSFWEQTASQDGRQELQEKKKKKAAY